MALDPVRTGPRIGAGRVAVLVPLPLAGTYDYTVPPGLSVAHGQFVLVPLGGRTVAGVVWGAAEDAIDPSRLRAIDSVLDAPPMTRDLRETIAWTAAYTLSPPGALLRMAMSVPEALDPPRPETAYARRPEPLPDGLRMTEARGRLLRFLADGEPKRMREIGGGAGVGPSVVRGLVAAGAVAPVSLSSETPPPVPDWRRRGATLTTSQETAAARLRALVAAPGAHGVTLLDGVTGSGKTEVYFEAIAAALARGRQVLVLLPEIALTVDWLRRFSDRFGAPPALWHSDISRPARRALWRAVARGEAPVVVGARSALFLPFRSLGLIVVDEEHDAGYKQEEGVVYNARDIAVVRARNAGCRLLLSSATPSLETVVNVGRGRYGSVRLAERFGSAGAASVSAVDMRAEAQAPRSWLSPSLRSAARQALDEGRQVLFFLNRRGYAPLTLCRGCGHRMSCPNCAAWLVDHRLAERLQCHHCGHREARPADCPQCGATDSLVACGPGVERLSEEAAAAFPDARIALMSSDTLRGPQAIDRLLAEIRARDYDLIIGTQLVAKGHDFPHLTLVGVIDADLGLEGGDLRAAERSFQLLHQVAGRAGRAAFPGRALVQTYDPDHPVMRALIAGDRDGFVAAETRARRAAGMPPFGRLAAIVVSGRRLEAVAEAGRALARAAPRQEGLLVLGPAPAPLALVRGRHRHRLLVKARSDIRIQPLLTAWLREAPARGGVRIQVDIDPYSFL